MNRNGQLQAIRRRLGRVTLRWVIYHLAMPWFSGLFYSRSLMRRRTKQLAFVPQDSWPGDARRGDSIIRGKFDFAGESIETTDQPWQLKQRSGAWLIKLHSFDWLGDLRADGGEHARERARELIGGWVESNGRWRLLPWRPDVLAARLINWLTHAEFVFADREGQLAKAWLDIVARQTRHLRRVAPLVDGAPERLLVFKALIYGSLCLAHERLRLQKWTAALVREVETQIAPDGGHVSRSPAVEFETFRHLIDVREVLRAAQAEVPEAVQNAIDRVAPMVRFFRHGDGGLCLFNDSNEGENWLIDVALSRSEARGKPLASAPHTGFERVAVNRTLVVMDTGTVPQPRFDCHAHAGTLSFELSVGKDRMIVNCGAYIGGRRDWRMAQRRTAAHSTVTINDHDSSEILPGALIGERPRSVAAERVEADGNIWIDARLTGYAGIPESIHQRRLYVTATGGDLRGEDTLSGCGNQPISVRFHLHPSVKASSVQDGGSVLLRLPSGGWRFRATGGETSLQESVYLGVAGEAKRCEQIVVSAATQGGHAQIKWGFTRLSRDP